MQCTSVSIFGLEAAALCLYCDRGSVVKLVTMAPWRCAEVEDGTSATMTFFYSRPVGPSSRKYPLRSTVSNGKFLARAMSTLDFTRRRQCCSLSLSFDIGTSLAVHTSSITLQVSSYPLWAICPQPLFPTVTLPVNRRYN